MVKDLSTGPDSSPSLNVEGANDGSGDDEVIVDELVDGATSEVPEHQKSIDGPSGDEIKGSRESGTDIEKPPEWVEWRESSDSVQPTNTTPDSAESSIANPDPTELPDPVPDYVESSNEAARSVELSGASTGFGEPSNADGPPILENEEPQVDSESHTNDSEPDTTDGFPSSITESLGLDKSNVGESVESEAAGLTSIPSHQSDTPYEALSSETSHQINEEKPAETEGTSGTGELNEQI